jgi:hypothetical protein
MDKKGGKKQTFDYFNNGAQYIMGIEWMNYHLDSSLTEFIICTSNNEYSRFLKNMWYHLNYL